MNKIRYKRFAVSETESARQYENGLIGCYREVFAGPPWFEDWAPEQIRIDLRDELTRYTSNSCWLALDRSARDASRGVVGFAWGYLHSA